MTPDPSNGYEAAADDFMIRRNLRIGPSVVRSWTKTLPTGATVLDLGCGSGVPISQVLIDAGFSLYGVDASPKMIAAFRGRFPQAHAECCAVEDSDFFHRTFDGVVAWGLLFLLPAEIQPLVIAKAARALNPGGKLLFTAPEAVCTWTDVLTERESISLGREAYVHILQAAGLDLIGEQSDEGENHYYLAVKSD